MSRKSNNNQQSCDKHTHAFADLQNKILEYRHATG